MDALTTVLVIILSIGMTQGFVFAVLLWKQAPAGSQANKYKAALLATLSYGLLNQVLRLFGIGYYDVWYHLTLDINWSYGPLLYLYVKAQANPDFHFSKGDRWVLLPILIQIICSVYVRSQNFFWDGTRDSLTWLGYYGYAYWRNYSTVPIIASLLIIFFSYKSMRVLNALNPSNVIPQNFRWVKNMVITFGSYYAVVLLILLADLIIFLLTVSSDYYYFTRFYYYPFFIGIAVLIYWLGLSNLVRSDQRIVKLKKTISEEDLKILTKLASRLQEVMEEKERYRDQELTLAKLAEELNIKSYLLTKTLSEVLNQSFTDYINEFRVKKVQELIQQPDNDKYTLLSLAYEAGFNSKSSFNRAVKKHLGISPSDLKRTD